MRRLLAAAALLVLAAAAPAAGETHQVTWHTYHQVLLGETKRHVQADFGSTGVRHGTSWTAAGWHVQYRHYLAADGVHVVRIKYAHRPGQGHRFHVRWKKWRTAR